MSRVGEHCVGEHIDKLNGQIALVFWMDEKRIANRQPYGRAVAV
ncbi:MAG: hypothetical protein AB7G93_10600 [Bdellovibrionales bacterium]